MNPHIRKMEFSIGSPVSMRAVELRQELSIGIPKSFAEVINAHIGDCHALGQKPLTYIRQIIALVLMPELINDASFPDDVKSRAMTLLKGCRNHSIGSYSDSPGMETVRKQIAKYIGERDGIKSCWKNIVCSNGATDIIKLVLNLFPSTEGDAKSGIMIPIPHCPLYSACITELDLHCIKYYLNEDKNWALEIEDLSQAVNEGRKYCTPKAIVVINPGNPTGQVLTRDNIVNVIKLAYEENLFILADEVYQDNVYAADCEFHSFKKVMAEMGAPYDSVQLASFMSGSKGFTGECGLRAGYTELINVDAKVIAMLVKTIASATCPTVLGQTVMYCATNPPMSYEPSFPVYNEEKSMIMDSFKLNARIAREILNSITGYSCQAIQGAIYAFPSIKMPPGAVKAAKGKYQDASEFYAMELIEATGVCVAPGCYFGQKPGTYHFRTTILLHPNELRAMLLKIKEFHHHFLSKYS